MIAVVQSLTKIYIPDALFDVLMDQWGMNESHMNHNGYYRKAKIGIIK